MAEEVIRRYVRRAKVCGGMQFLVLVFGRGSSVGIQHSECFIVVQSPSEEFPISRNGCFWVFSVPRAVFFEASFSRLMVAAALAIAV